VPQFLWDASALSKRYFPEIGSATVDVLFGMGSSVPKATAYLCYAEACASLRRRLNRGQLNSGGFHAARLLARKEILLDPDFRFVTISDADILAGIALTDQHNLNSSDAAILMSYLRYVRTQPPTAPTCLLIAADQRLIRAANAEGLQTLNPEAVAAADVPSFLATL
jgi:predicted nucleic acid-binding protein